MSGRMKPALIGYAVVAVITFGHAASNTNHCLRQIRCGTLAEAILGAYAGVFWPLYWSWEAWS